LNTSFQYVRWIFITGILLSFIAIIADYFLDPSHRTFHYVVAALFCFTGLHYLFVGLAHVYEARSQGQNAIWHQQPALLIGLFVLLGAFASFIYDGEGSIFPQAIADIVDTPLLVLLVIFSLLLFIRAIIYGIKKRMISREHH